MVLRDATWGRPRWFPLAPYVTLTRCGSEVDSGAGSSPKRVKEASMSTGNRAKTLLAFAAGLGLGLAVLAGYAIGVRNNTPELKLHAMSGYGSDTFGMVTGPVDTEAEGVFTLDYNTGELRCFVINPRTGRFGAGF